MDAWALERESARRALRAHNPPGLIDALLDDGENDLAWQTATGTPGTALDDHAWLRLAEARQNTHLRQTLLIYWRIIDTTLQTADRRAHASVIRLLTRARDAARAAGETSGFDARVIKLREQNKRRPTLIAMLDKANLWPA